MIIHHKYKKAKSVTRKTRALYVMKLCCLECNLSFYQLAFLLIVGNELFVIVFRIFCLHSFGVKHKRQSLSWITSLFFEIATLSGEIFIYSSPVVTIMLLFKNVTFQCTLFQPEHFTASTVALQRFHASKEAVISYAAISDDLCFVLPR